MKCIVLAGGKGESLWPLSRNNCPKQFIEIENNHSIFQDTVARNIQYCDEFIIVTNKDYKYLVENQMEPFQGLNYRCIYQEKWEKMTAMIILACLSIEPTEYVLVTNTNTLISDPRYKDAMVIAKKNAREGYISILVSKKNKIASRHGYMIEKDGDNVKKYIANPNSESVGALYKDLGFLVFQNGVLLKTLDLKVLNECKQVYKNREFNKGDTNYKSIDVTPISIEKSVLEKSQNIKAVEIDFLYKDIRTLGDVIGYKNKGPVVNNSTTSQVINARDKKAVVVDGVDDLIVVNTDDALYIGKKGSDIKEILKNSQIKDYEEKSTCFNRSWGKYEDLVVEKNYRLRRVVINPGKTIYEHVHKKRVETWTVLKGKMKFTLNGEEMFAVAGDTVSTKTGDKHQISNVTDTSLVLVETAVGDIIHEDIHSTSDEQTTETQLGISFEPMVKLTPALKDYQWGGNQLKDRYGIESDLDVVAEAWELSAHPAGESVVTTGRHKGLTLSKYIETVGKSVLGWKCAPLQSFPILVKFIDAKGNLSIQVHPDDDYALEHENQYGKSEMWYVIDSKPGAGLYVGFNRKVDKNEVRRRIENNTITEILNFYPTRKGDIFFIPAGTIHAICEGNLICEIQQSSNCTYRLYDYNRRDKFGNSRELHIDKALDVLNCDKYDLKKEKISCKYFVSKVLDVEEKTIRINDESFLAIIILEGKGYLLIDDYKLEVKSGDSIFVPAQNNTLKFNGNMKLNIIHI